MANYTAPSDRAVGDAITENDWDTAVKGNSEYFKERHDNLDFVRITADVSVTGANEGAATAVINGTSKAYDNSDKLIEFWCPYFTMGAGGDTVTFVLLRGATVIGQAKASGNTDEMPVKLEYFDLAPAAGTYAYFVKAFKTGTSITIKAGAGGASGLLMPAFLRVRRVS